MPKLNDNLANQLVIKLRGLADHVPVDDVRLCVNEHVDTAALLLAAMQPASVEPRAGLPWKETSQRLADATMRLFMILQSDEVTKAAQEYRAAFEDHMLCEIPDQTEQAR